ncbi:MAG: hypothetical protein AB7O97_10070 [Planctomycetota bacterium]
MRLPVNAFLYLASAGLLGLAGYTFYESMQLGTQDVRTEHTERGAREAQDLLARGRGQGPVTTTVGYNTAVWKAAFLAPNLIAKPPRIEEPKGPAVEVQTQKPVDVRPLGDIIELVSLMCDTSTGGMGGQSHVIVRYKEGVDVQPPSWYLLENQVAAGAGAVSAPSDGVPGRPRPNGRPVPGRPAQPVPMSSAGTEYLQRVWVTSDGSARSESTLWPPFEDIRLVEVKEDALSAVFARSAPPAPAPAEGEDPPPAPEPVTEELFKSLMASQEVAKDVVALLRNRARRPTDDAGTPAPVGNSSWQDVEETRKVGDQWHISRRDQQVMNESPETFMNRINVDAYVSPTGSGRRGLRVLDVAPDITSRYGVQPNELILSVNNEPVSTKADAIATGKRLYKRGVRTFVVKFLSGGREIERTYQAPDR